MILRFILVCVVLGIHSCNGYRILAIFPIQGRSHFSVMEQVAKGLAEKGHQVDVISGYPLKEPFPNYTEIIKLPAADSTYEFRYENFIYRRYALEGLHHYLKEICHLVGIPEFSRIIKNPPTNPPYDLILTQYVTGYHCFTAIGHIWNIPVVGVVTTFLYAHIDHYIGNPLNLAIAPRNLRAYKDPMNFWDRLYNVVMTNYEIYEHYILAEQQEAVIKQYFGPNIPHYKDLETTVAMLLSNSHYSLHGVKPKTPALIEIGGIHITDDNSTIDVNLKKLLDDSKNGFIYFSFGSITSIESLPKEVLTKFWNTFRKYPSIKIIMKAVNPKALPEGVPDNVFIFPWLPQKKILQHQNIKGFVSHGGGLGTQETVYYGVPTICTPFFADQHINCDITSIKGFGQRLDILTSTQEEFDHAFKEILFNPKYKKAIEKMSILYRDRPRSPKDEAVYWIEYVARHGKNVLRSRAVDLTWWQINLLDVYGFIIVSIITVLYILIFTIKRSAKLLVSISESLKNNYVTTSKKLK